MPSWTAPRTWVTSEIVSATLLNTHLRDNLLNTHSEYAITLPATPSDGQMAILVDSLTNPTYHWHMRYNASNSNTDKWEFIGGTDMLSNSADVSHANVSSYRFSTVGLTVPVSGVYDTIVTSPYHSTAGGGSAAYTVGINATTTFSVEMQVPGQDGSIYFPTRYTLAAGDALTVAYRVIAGSISYNLHSAQIRLRPVRL